MNREFKILIDDSKPHLKKAMQENPALAKEVIATFVGMMEHAFEYGWAELPKQFHPKLTFSGMIHDILHGVLDLKDIDPEYYDDLGVAVHPFGLFSMPIPDMSKTAGIKYYDWQRHFDWEQGDLPPIQSILRKLMYYARYIEIDKLGEALFHDHKHSYVVERDPSSLIAIQPALRYQKEHLGERSVGKLMDKYGVLDCGKLTIETNRCPACSLGELVELSDDTWACERCGAGYMK